ncbi:inactive protein RESTRICTED TEV MOVEMENT 2-like [Populus nigra]|uniref:inactive protein RESTRICTED TEV MOVEMENT 2-like n=1 Tax=Populus nigra TaxID=3691 RepID=UPI002B26B3C4|nr:inactive protein RESTRICTED TEV MOVEMENT 2-like [Populus nigra]
METKNEETFKLYYNDFEPFCQWKKDEHEILEIHLRGFKKQHLRVQVEEPGVVKITGERPIDGTLRSRFRKQIKIPKTCKTDEIRAKLSGDILQIIVPKQTTAFPAKPGSTGSITRSESMPSNYLLYIESSSSTLEMTTKLALQVAGVLAVVVAFGAYAYKYCHCGHVEG